MKAVKNPILLDSNLNDLEMLRPTKGSLTLRLCGVSEESLTLPVDSPNVVMHAWIKVFNQNGFVGYFRRTSNGKTIPNDQSMTFRHGIDILQDSIWAQETDYEGTKADFLAQLLNQQTGLIKGVKPWVLGTCEDTSSYKKSIKFDNLMNLLQDLEDEGGDYYFSYDQTVWPWRVSFLRRSSTVASEFRLKRNMEKCRISENDSELCTRLILQVNAMAADASIGVDQNTMVARTYDNAAAQAVYGVIVRTEDIDTEDTLPNGPFPEADAYAAKYLADRAEPLVTIQIDGRELFHQTGDTWDEAQLGTLCRVAIPDYAAFISQRVVGVTYSDQFGLSDRVTISLSNATPKTLREKSSLSRSVAAAERAAARAGGGGRANAREAESFQQHFKITDDAGKILRQAGMVLDANGMLVYADDNENMVGSRFNVQADKIGMVVGTKNGQNFIKAGEIALSINNSGESTALINADHIYIGADPSIPSKYSERTLGATVTQIGTDFTTVNTLLARKIEASDITSDFLYSKITAVNSISANSITAGSITVLTGGSSSSVASQAYVNGCIYGTISATASGGQITLRGNRLGTSGQVNLVTFNIADTQFYQDGVSAAAAAEAAKYRTVQAYRNTGSGSAYLRGNALTATWQGALYYSDGERAGTGKWYLRTTSQNAYPGNGTRLEAVELYERV